MRRPQEPPVPMTWKFYVYIHIIFIYIYMYILYVYCWFCLHHNWILCLIVIRKLQEPLDAAGGMLRALAHVASGVWPKFPAMQKVCKRLLSFTAQILAWQFFKFDWIQLNLAFRNAMICEQLHCRGTMGKQHDQTWLLEPLMLSRRDELIRHDLQGNGDALSYDWHSYILCNSF